jgi:hypothetical protein
MSNDNDEDKPSDAPAETPWPPGQPVIARAGQYYRNTRYLMAVILVGMGLWFGYDGFFTWPEANQKYRQFDQEAIAARRRGDRVGEQRAIQEQRKYKPHSDTDILLQKILFFALPPLGLIVLVRALHNSRGEYRLEGTTLRVPGHPPVPFENITEIDRHLWDRKGIAYISYDLGDGRQGRLRLDDFVYERPPTDEIFKRVEVYVTPPQSEPQSDDAAKRKDEAHG